MKPVGMLMIEHRLIERMVKLMKVELEKIQKKNECEISFVNSAIDFFRIYADRTHHGKEEDILFRDILKKPLSDELKKITDELIAEHVVARKTVGALASAKDEYQSGDKSALAEIASMLVALIKLYPPHIEKEDKHYFFPVQEYLNEAEQNAMIEEFKEFDRKMIHEKYMKAVENLEKK